MSALAAVGLRPRLSERKRAEEALRAAPRRSETILESISDDFFVVDREWRYTYVNERGLAQARRAMARDITAAELLGMTVWEVAPQIVGGTITTSFIGRCASSGPRSSRRTPRQPGVRWRSASTRPNTE